MAITTNILIPKGTKANLTTLASSSGLTEAELYYVTDETAVYIGTSATTYALVGTTDHTALSNIGTNTHAQIDTHLSNTSNPHTVTASQVGNGTAQWNANQLQGVAISSTAPADTEVLTYNATTSEWGPAAAGGGSSGWGLSGNAIVSGEFLGSTNNEDIVLKRNNISYGKFAADSVNIGAYAGDNLTTGWQVAIGYSAGRFNTSGRQVAIGYWAGRSNSTGNQIAIGAYAGGSNSTGTQVAIGYYAGESNSTGHQVAIGYYAGSDCNTLSYQVAIGFRAGEHATSGNQVAIGMQAGHNNVSSNLVCIGYQTGVNATGDGGVYIGYQTAALTTAITTGTNNTFIGYSVQSTSATRTNSVAIGYGVSSDADNQVRLGDSAITTMYCYGAYAATTASGANVYVDATGKIQRSTSSRRYKKDIVNLETDTNKLYQLKPVTFTEKSTNKKNFGLIAEDVAKVLPELVIYARKSDVIPGIKTERIKQETKEQIAKQILSVRAEILKEEDAERKKELEKEETKLKAETDKIAVGTIDNTLIPEAIDYAKLSVLLLNEMKQMRAEIDKLKAR